MLRYGWSICVNRSCFKQVNTHVFECLTTKGCWSVLWLERQFDISPYKYWRENTIRNSKPFAVHYIRDVFFYLIRDILQNSRKLELCFSAPFPGKRFVSSRKIVLITFLNWNIFSKNYGIIISLLFFPSFTCNFKNVSYFFRNFHFYLRWKLTSVGFWVNVNLLCLNLI